MEATLYILTPLVKLEAGPCLWRIQVGADGCWELGG